MLLQLLSGLCDFLMCGVVGIVLIVLAALVCNEVESYGRLNISRQEEVLVSEPVETEDSTLILKAQLFELHGTLVIKKINIPVTLPTKLKVFSLRGDAVVRLSDLQDFYGTVAIDAEEVLRKWEQWNEHPRKKQKSRSRKPLREVALLNGGFGHGTPSALPV